MEEIINTGIYIRVSTEEQVKDGFSIHAQKEKLTMYAKINDWKIYDYYIDDGISGKNIEARPEIKRMINDIKEKKVNNVLIYKLDRLTRSVKDLIELIELFEKYQCTFSSQTEKIDTSNAVGRMFIKIIGIFAEFERENLAERVALGYEQKTREGNYTNTYGVYGYDYLTHNQKLVVNLEEKKLVNDIYDFFIEGRSFYKIASFLNDNHVKTKRGGKWQAATIKSILNNPLYIGNVRYGVQNKSKSFEVRGKNIEPIITKEKWNLVKMLLEKRSKNKLRRHHNDYAYYYQVIKCPICNSYYKEHQQMYKDKKYIKYKCLCNSIKHEDVEKIFVDYLSKNIKISIENKFIKEFIDKEKNSNMSSSKFYNIIINFKLNWSYLNNHEKKQFLERIIETISINCNDFSINCITFNNYLLSNKESIENGL